MLAGGRVRVNDAITRRADTPLATGDVVEVGARGPRAPLLPGLALVYEDDDVIIVDKPAGLLTIATERERERTTYTHLMAHGRAAVTRWRVLRAGTRHTLLEVRLETGRRNQIRVHFAGLGHPVAGDDTYGSRTDPFGRLALHAHVLGFDHPRSGARLRFVSK